ncbi:hypothetical protein [Cellulosimicrobium sp. KWT-B]|uniref:hypothetical protein n=1 Tax=Cellulosimicrobium sp. KWT-B TaxID=1981152 RepID=UPI000A31FDCB|nr:hypothetical protein [Cellulosimicrobium sp. KWT-B]
MTTDHPLDAVAPGGPLGADPSDSTRWAEYAAAAFGPDPEAERARLRAEDADTAAARTAALQRLRDWAAGDGA